MSNTLPSYEWAAVEIDWENTLDVPLKWRWHPMTPVQERNLNDVLENENIFKPFDGNGGFCRYWESLFDVHIKGIAYKLFHHIALAHHSIIVRKIQTQVMAFQIEVQHTIPSTKHVRVFSLGGTCVYAVDRAVADKLTHKTLTSKILKLIVFSDKYPTVTWSTTVRFVNSAESGDSIAPPTSHVFIPSKWCLLPRAKIAPQKALKQMCITDYIKKPKWFKQTRITMFFKIKDRKSLRITRITEYF